MPNLDAKAYEHYQKELLSAKELERQEEQFDKAGKTPPALIKKVAKIKGGNTSIGLAIITNALGQKGESKEAAQSLYSGINFKNETIAQVLKVWDIKDIDLSGNPQSANGVATPAKVVFKTARVQIIDKELNLTDTTAIATHLKFIGDAMDSQDIYGDVIVSLVIEPDLSSFWKIEIV
jgi:hypothetical protein